MMISSALKEGIVDVAIEISHKFAFYKINDNLGRNLNLHHNFAFIFFLNMHGSREKELFI